MDRPAYAAFMALALATALLARRFVPKPPELASLHWNQRFAIGVAALVGGVFGAKFPFVLAGEEAGWSGAAWIADGKTIVTGLAGAYLAVELVKLAMGIRVKTGDTFALPLALALAVGRWGCFFNGCCAGAASSLPWAVNFGDGVGRHPTQIYEVLFHLSMAAVLWVCIRKQWLPRQQLKLYLIAYCGFRFLIEFIRVEPEWWAGLSVYQWACAAFAGALAAQWAVDAHPIATASAPSMRVADTGNNP